ncbi:MAG: hypothetical protein AAGK09_02360 [Planctomycetota bacterium]
MSDPTAAWSAVSAAVGGQRALAWLRKTRLVSLVPAEDGAGGWAAVIEPLPGHGDLTAFATPARLAPAGVLAAQVLGARVTIEMRARIDERPASPTGETQTVDDLPLVRRMKEVFADYDVRLIGQWPAEGRTGAGGVGDAEEGPERSA